MKGYDPANPDPRYHADWALRYAKRAVVYARLAITLVVALVVLRLVLVLV